MTIEMTQRTLSMRLYSLDVPVHHVTAVVAMLAIYRTS